MPRTRELGTDYIDVYQLHGIAPAAYDHALNELAPALLREKERASSAISGFPRPRRTTPSTAW
jgi:aryl-alcohol dehydrogenase-like predicted oxidoreductase